MNDIKYFGKYDSKYESIFRLQIFLLSLPRVKLARTLVCRLPLIG